MNVLEKLIENLITNQIIDIKLLAINAEKAGIKAFEIVQDFIAQYEGGEGQGEGSNLPDAPAGSIDVGGGGLGSSRFKTKEKPKA